MRESGPLDRFVVIQVEVQVEFEAQVQSNKSIHTGRGSSRHKSRGSTYESRIQELRHKSVHYRHTSRGIDVRVEVLVSTGVEAQVCTARDIRVEALCIQVEAQGIRVEVLGSRGTKYTSRGTKHQHTSLRMREAANTSAYDYSSARHQSDTNQEALGIRVEAPRTSAYKSRHESRH